MSNTVKKAIIFTKNQTLGRFIELELLLFEYESVISDMSHGITQNNKSTSYAAIIFDTTSLTLDAQLHSFIHATDAAIKIALTNDTEKDTIPFFEHCISLPLSLFELRKVLSGTKETRTETERDREGSNEQKCFISDDKSRTVSFRGAAIKLSKHEYDLLDLLCKNTSSYVSRAEIDDMLGASGSNITDVYVCHLRKKLEKPFGIKVIYTERDKGYMTDYTIK